MTDQKNPQLQGKAIMVPVSGMSRSTAFCQGVLGICRENDSYALLARDHAAVAPATGATGQSGHHSA